VSRSAGITGAWPSRAWCGRSALYSATHLSSVACAASTEPTQRAQVSDIVPVSRVPVCQRIANSRCQSDPAARAKITAVSGKAWVTAAVRLETRSLV
jgi:hypothetical protein